jgi:hypothetical protein
MQIKNIIISFLFISESVISAPRRNKNHVEATEATEAIEAIEAIHHKRSPRRNRNHVEATEATEAFHVEVATIKKG